MENDWYSLGDAARHLNVSVRTLQRRIKAGKYAAKFTGAGSRVVCLRNIDATTDDAGATIYDAGATINDTGATIDDTDTTDDVSPTIGLQEQLRHVCRQNDMLTQHLAEANQQLGEQSKRHDTIVMQLTQQLDRAHLQLEDKRSRKWWQIFRRSLAPTHVL